MQLINDIYKIEKHQENNLDKRNFYVPFENLEEAKKANPYEIEKSSRIDSLNGAWDFQLHKSPHFIEERNDWDRIYVPGHWELQGFSAPHYTNVRYPFPIDPPFIPKENHLGIYKKKYFYQKTDDFKHIIRFEGVDSAFHLFLNDEYIGMHKGSRNPVEFEISQALKEGENIITLFVYEWNVETYLEDQDMWWMHGIFREAYIIHRPKKHIHAYRITSDAKGFFKIDFETFNHPLPEKNILLIMDKENQTILKKDISGKESFSIQLENIETWNPERPYLYQLFLLSEDNKQPEVIKEWVGFRSIQMKNRQIIFNGDPIVLRGVNKHEIDPQNGRHIPIKRLIEELKLMKKANINAIRTAHYPHHPHFYYLCDYFGFYVMDEADLEAHGLEYSGNIHQLSENPEWKDIFVSRMQEMVIRDFNRPSIFSWSIGNESGHGENIIAMIEWTKKFDSSRLIHHEGETREREDIYERIYDKDTKYSDINSTMYTPHDILEELGKNEDLEKPHLLCEYAHAMGNGPGGLDDYVNIFYKYQGLLGGFIWEWMDQGLLKKENNIEYYAYGGDFGDYPNDYNFVLDGVVQPDLKPSPAFFEMQAAYQPIQFKLKDQKLLIENRFNHTRINNETLTIRYLNEDFNLLDETKVKIDLESLASTQFDFDKKENLHFIDLSLLGFKKRLLVLEPKGKMISSQKEAIKHHYQGHYLLLKSDDLSLKINLFTGEIEEILYHDKQILSNPISFNTYRAITDNDHISEKMWKEYGYHELSAYLVDYQVNKETIKIKQMYASKGLHNLFDITWELSFLRNGALKFKGEVEKRGKHAEYLPSLGWVIPLKDQFDHISWKGLGPHEAYPDTHAASYYGLHQLKFDEFNFNYLYPQETGNRMMVRELSLNNPYIIQIKSLQDSFNFKISPYSVKEIIEAQHPHDLDPSKQSFLHIDLAMHGIGSRSCGPDVQSKYYIKKDRFPFEFIIDFKNN